MTAATVKSTATKSSTMKSARMESATMEPVTVESITESVEAFAEKSTLAISAIAVALPGIAVTSVIPPTVETSRQAEGYNQKHAKDNQLYFHYLMRRQAGRMTSGAEDIRLAIANPIPRAAPVTTATLPESPFMTVLPCLISP